MQVVGYEPERATDECDAPSVPALLVARDGRVEREPLVAGRELTYTLGERRCAGVTDGHEHTTCDRPKAPYCDVHHSTWVCAKCTGTCLKAEMDCFQTHAVYLAAFAPNTFKVGVTKLPRLVTRLREQGADCGAHIYTVSDGRIAREIEADLAAEPTLGLSDRVRVPTKIQGMGRSVDDGAWNRLLVEFDALETFSFDYGLGLDAAPVAETLASGTVVGTKGRVLVLERGGDRYAVDLRDLLGYELHRGTPSRELQSSLGSFG